MRSGKPWPAAVRTIGINGPPAADRELRRLAAGRRSCWALPVTATEEERLLADAAGTAAGAVRADRHFQPEPGDGRLAGRRLPALRLFDRLAAAAAVRCGSAARRRCYSTAPNAGARSATSCGSWRPRWPRRRWWRCWICPADRGVDRARSAGAAAVLSKPLQLEDLYWHLDRVV